MLGAGNRGPKPGNTDMEEAKLLSQYAPYLIPFLGAIIVIVFTKKYLFAGMISAEMYKEQLDREKETVKIQENIANQLQEVVRQLEGITRKVSEDIRSSNDRTTSLEHAMSSYIDEFRDLNKTLTARPCLLTQGGNA
jgi:sensor domain CHASE-containing protein